MARKPKIFVRKPPRSVDPFTLERWELLLRLMKQELSLLEHLDATVWAALELRALSDEFVQQDADGVDVNVPFAPTWVYSDTFNT